MALHFADRPPGNVPDLHRQTLELFYQLGAGAEGRLHRDVEISSAGTSFAHGLQSIPQSVLIAPKEATEGPPYLDPDRQADGRLLYLKAVPTTMYFYMPGSAGAGSCPVTGLLVGDVVEFVYSAAAVTTSSFEPVATLAGELQQTSAADLSLEVFLLIIKRPVSINCDLLVLP